MTTVVCDYLHDRSIGQSYLFRAPNLLLLLIHNLYGCGAILNTSMIGFVAKSVLYFKRRCDVAFCNIEFFNGQISWHINDFNSVDEGTKHLADTVGCADENHFGHVKLEVQV